MNSVQYVKAVSYTHLGMPVRLGEAGIDDSRLLEMAEKCCAKGPQGQFQKLHTRDVHAIYELAL